MKRSVGYEAILLTFSKGLTLFLALVANMLLARFATVEEYGTLSQVVVAVSLASAVILLGLPYAVNYFMARLDNPEERKAFVTTFMSAITLLSIFAGLLLVAGRSLLVEYFSNEELGGLGYLLVVLPWAGVTVSSLQSMLVVLGKMRLLLYFTLSTSLGGLASIGIAIYAKLSFNEYLGLYAVVQAIASSAVYIVVGTQVGYEARLFSWKLLRQILAFSIPMGVASAMGTLNTLIDRLVLGRLATTYEVGLYGNVGRELPVAIVATSVSAVVLPRVVLMVKSGKSLNALSLWGHASHLSYSLIAVLCSMFFVFAPELVVLLFSEKYLEGVGVFRVYTLVLLLRFTYFGMFLNASGRTRAILISAISGVVINAPLSVILFYWLGLIGPAVATFGTLLGVQILQLVLSARVASVNFGQIFPWLKIWRTSFLNIMLLGVVWGIKNTGALGVWVGQSGQAVLLCIGWSAIYLAIVYRPLKQEWKSMNSSS